MGIAVVMVIVVLSIIVVVSIRSTQEQRQTALMQAFDPSFTVAPPRGGNVRARGLVLAASKQSTGTTNGGQRYEQRYMTIEVEIPGETPYVTRGSFLLPRGLVDGIPGSSLELSVDRSNPSYVSVLGPGGFTGPWIQSGPPRPY
jgi:hypothetical protein